MTATRSSSRARERRTTRPARLGDAAAASRSTTASSRPSGARRPSAGRPGRPRCSPRRPSARSAGDRRRVGGAAPGRRLGGAPGASGHQPGATRGWCREASAALLRGRQRGRPRPAAAAPSTASFETGTDSEPSARLHAPSLILPKRGSISMSAFAAYCRAQPVALGEGCVVGPSAACAAVACSERLRPSSTIALLGRGELARRPRRRCPGRPRARCRGRRSATPRRCATRAGRRASTSVDVGGELVASRICERCEPGGPSARRPASPWTPPSAQSTSAKSSTCWSVIRWPSTSAATPGAFPLHAASSSDGSRPRPRGAGRGPCRTGRRSRSSRPQSPSRRHGPLP